MNFEFLVKPWEVLLLGQRVVLDSFDEGISWIFAYSTEQRLLMLCDKLILNMIDTLLMLCVFEFPSILLINVPNLYILSLLQLYGVELS